jgi:hypothetical protein
MIAGEGFPPSGWTPPISWEDVASKQGSAGTRLLKVKTALLVAAMLVASVLPARTFGAVSFVVRGDTRIGSFAVKADGKLSGAIRAFGEPTRLRRRIESCTATWPTYGLTIYVYNLGGHDPCSPQYGYFSRAVMHGDRWRTSGERHFWPSGWWLVTRGSAFGAGDTSTSAIRLAATSGQGRGGF